MNIENTIPVFAIVILCVFVFSPGIILSIAALSIGGMYNRITCDGTMMPLPVWLQIYGGLELSMISILCLLLVIGIIKENHIMLFVFEILHIIFIIFGLCWNIVGAVALFRDGMDCIIDARPVWDMTLALLIIQWLSIVIKCFSQKKMREKKNESNNN